MVTIALFIVCSLVLLASWIFLIVMPLHDAADALPSEFQAISPSSVFLLIFPLFSAVWLYYVVIQISSGYQRYFASKQIVIHGGCGFGVGLASAICISATIIPFLWLIAGPAGFVCMIIYLLTIVRCKNAALALVNDDDISALSNGAGPGALPATPEPSGLLPEAGIQLDEPAD